MNSNYEKWLHYMDGFASPDQYIKWGFYYLIAAALQRRVWCGPAHSPCYPNIYVILTGEPAVGKGLVIKQVSSILNYHKMPDPKEFANKKTINVPANIDTADKIIAEAMEEENYNNAKEVVAAVDDKTKAINKPPIFIDKPNLIPVAADATTYEALCRSLARAFRRKSYTLKEPDGKNTLKSYPHSSLCFCLEEISSLFRRKTEDIVHFLIQAYDCGDYTYDTKTQGKDKIRACCLNFFGGTTPSFMRQAFDDSLISEGFSSRTFFVYAAKNRNRPFWIPALSPIQESYRKDLIAHIKSLTELYGNAQFTEEANTYLEEWWNKFQSGERPNSNVKLSPYYGRKKVHVLKLCMAVHFGENTEMLIQKHTVETVLNMLAEEEKRMHFCLGLEQANPASRCADKIVKYLNNMPGRKVTVKELFVEFFDNIPQSSKSPIESLEEVLRSLEYAGKIVETTEPHPVTNITMKFYSVKEESKI